MLASKSDTPRGIKAAPEMKASACACTPGHIVLMGSAVKGSESSTVNVRRRRRAQAP
jgi:hypothetical protein